MEEKAIDEALDLFQVLMATRLLNTAKRKTEEERLSTLYPHHRWHPSTSIEETTRHLAPAAKHLSPHLTSRNTPAILGKTTTSKRAVGRMSVS
ncbi:hypothetical protein [Rhodococcus gordoniae]